MAIYLTPTFGPPLPTSPQQPLDVDKMAAGATKTLDLLAQHGLEISYTDADIEAAGKVTLAFAKNPDEASRSLTDKRIGQMTPAALRAIDQQLKKFSHNIVESAEQVRNFVTNRLIEESDNPDPRIRIKALELLGKISDVGLFAEKSEITIVNKTTDDLRANLRAKLSKLMNPIEDADIIDAAPLLTAEILDSAWDDEDGYE